MPSWFRAFHGISSDPKYRRIAKRAGARVGDVVAVWLHVLDQASQDDDEGRADIDVETAADFLDVDEETVAAILQAMTQGAALIECHGVTPLRTVTDRYEPLRVTVVNWPSRQGGSDRTSAERQRRHRERKKSTKSMDGPETSRRNAVTERYVTPEQSRAEQRDTCPSDTQAPAAPATEPPKAAPADASASTNTGNPTKAVFDRGLALLAGADYRPAHARSFLGKLRKQYGDGACIDAIARAEAEAPSEPAEFLVKALQAGGSRSPPGGDWHADMAKRVMGKFNGGSNGRRANGGDRGGADLVDGTVEHLPGRSAGD